MRFTQSNIEKMKVLSGKQIVYAPGTPKFPPKVAYTLLDMARQSGSAGKSLYDPFCGNGMVLLVAALNFKDYFPNISGSDLNPEAVDATRLNLLEVSDQEEEILKSINVADTARDIIQVDQSIVVTDPPFGRRCKFSEDEFLYKAFKNLRRNGAQNIFFCFDGKTPLPKSLNDSYRVEEVYRNWDRSFYWAH